MLQELQGKHTVREQKRINDGFYLAFSSFSIMFSLLPVPTRSHEDLARKVYESNIAEGQNTVDFYRRIRKTQSMYCIVQHIPKF